jgi:hypothetical protein
MAFARLCFPGARASLGFASLRGRFATLPAARNLHRHRTHYIADPRTMRIAARDAHPPVAFIAIRRDAEHLVLLVSAQDPDPVITHTDEHLEQLGAPARERRDQHAIARARLARVVDPVLAPHVVARAPARDQLGLEQTVGARHAPGSARAALDPALVLELAQHPPQRAQLVVVGAEHTQEARGSQPAAAATRERADDALTVEFAASRALRIARAPSLATLRRPARAPHLVNVR